MVMKLLGTSWMMYWYKNNILKKTVLMKMAIYSVRHDNSGLVKGKDVRDNQQPAVEVPLAQQLEIFDTHYTISTRPVP